jgi:MFS family permease
LSTQFGLLRERRFGPFFWTQFSGAANDNLFKFAFTVMVTYQLQVAWLPPALAGLVIGALFILPFFLFSATAGQLADALPKEQIFRAVKSLEIAIMLIAAFGFWMGWVGLLLSCVFLMGLHSTVFGPAKYAYLPQVLKPAELVGGNGMVEMGTFVAILLGNLVGGLLITLPEIGVAVSAAACILVACWGRWMAQGIPNSETKGKAHEDAEKTKVLSTPAPSPINWNPFTETWRNLVLSRQDPLVFRSLLAISWMWFFGAVYLSQFPSFAKEVLHGDAQVASMMLVVFSMGVGAGALMCERLSQHQSANGLVPLGALGMTVFSLDLSAVSSGLPASELQSLTAFLTVPAHGHLVLDLFLLSASVGLYSVPLYALIQEKAQPDHRARIIAANNILNALFMVVSSVGVGALLVAGWTIPRVFAAMASVNALFAIWFFASTGVFWAAFKRRWRGLI